ncbi:alpha/beta fold hydrolase [Kutzneria kofuensis]
MVGGAAAALIVSSGTGISSAAPATIPAADRQVQFVVDGTTTYGTLHVPAHRPGARLAVALLLPGSGPTDRNGDQPPGFTPATLRLIADVLGQDGVISLRFDKYFTGRTGPGRYRDDPGRIDMAAFTRQAVAAYDVMREQPETDQHALLIVGHSEGGLQALLVARAARPKPVGLALLEPQDLPALDMMDYQVAGQLDQAAAAGVITREVAERNKAAVREGITDFRARHPVVVEGLLPGVAALLRDLDNPLKSRFIHSVDAIYPPDVARRIGPGTRVMVTCGTADTQVPCWTTSPLLRALSAAHATGPGLRVLPEVDHFLHPAGTPVDDQILAESARLALHEFLRPWWNDGGGDARLR